MRKNLLPIGKTVNKNLKTLINDYHKSTQKYHLFDSEIISEIKNCKNFSQSLQKSKEGELIHTKKTGNSIILLNKNIKQYDSLDISKYIDKKIMPYFTRLIFVIGSHYGLSDKVIGKSHQKLSFSKMTFSYRYNKAIICRSIISRQCHS